MAEVPDELVAWFSGKGVLADRYGMPRIETRIRVVEVLANLGEPDEPYVVKGEWREFKSHIAAQRYRDRLVNEGKVTLVQYAPVFWLTADEMPGDDDHAPQVSDEQRAIGP